MSNTRKFGRPNFFHWLGVGERDESEGEVLQSAATRAQEGNELGSGRGA